MSKPLMKQKFTADGSQARKIRKKLRNENIINKTLKVAVNNLQIST